jgi:hypothetical protein
MPSRASAQTSNSAWFEQAAQIEADQRFVFCD